MISPTPSARPECIRVMVIDSDDRLSKDLSRDLGDRIGARVECIKQLTLNGLRPSFHVLIVNQEADPGLESLRTLREKWSEQEVPVIVVGNDDAGEIVAIRAGASQFVDRSMHPDSGLIEKLVYGLAYDR